ncbi:MAG: transcription termination/antitermination protein NusG [Epulopiscium sp. Nuni2H_MBin003]|nr:MAG: transcription termination/antitermination protein NusG [Epulopiscium sp. Nuni2H_MBin003]
MDEAKWYVVHTYSGYENKVKVNIEKAIKNRNMQELIQQVEIPMHDEAEEKNGVTKMVSRKVFPGYVLIKMTMTDDAWYVVRNTRGVTGFVGPDSKPVPLSLGEIEKMGIDVSMFKSKFLLADLVQVISGSFVGSEGIIKEINETNERVIVSIMGFGSEFPLEVSFDDIKKIM